MRTCIFLCQLCRWRRFFTLLIYTNFNRDIATFDVPGAFLKAELPEGWGMVLLKLRDIFVEIMCEVNKEYKETVTYEDVTKLL